MSVISFVIIILFVIPSILYLIFFLRNEIKKHKTIKRNKTKIKKPRFYYKF